MPLGSASFCTTAPLLMNRLVPSEARPWQLLTPVATTAGVLPSSGSGSDSMAPKAVDQ